MSNVRDLFERHCGDRFDQFMEKLYANERGEIELKFWQEQVVDSFLSLHPELNLDRTTLVNDIRDGTEVVYACPEPECRGNVGCIDRKSDQWACAECGEVFSSKSALAEALAEAEQRALP